MTTTHTQPAGCDLDSLQRFNNRGGLMNPEANGLYVRFEDAARAAQAQQGDTRQVAPVDYVLMPKRLTAENGAKGALSGEFKESIRVTCHECDGSGEGETDDGNCAECKGDGTVDAAVTVSWDTIKDIYKAAVALLATQAAHTCTPADERADTCLMCNDSGIVGFPPDQYEECPDCIKDRAAQGAGTAPVDATDPVQIVREAVRQLAESPRRKDSSYVEGMVVGANMCLVRLERVLGRAATHPAPVSTAAATTASVSALTDQRILEIFNECGDGISTVGFARAIEREALAPSRAADGQQGASRAVLSDEQIDQIARAYFSEEWAQKHAKDAIHDAFAALARAPLPAQGDARLEVFIDWYLRGGEYAEINPNGHMVRTTREQILEWLDRAAQSRAQSDTTGENHG